MRKAAAALIGLLVLTGCSDEPSEKDMRTAVEGLARQRLERQGKTYHPFLSFRKQGCIEGKSEPGDYDCYYYAIIPFAGAWQNLEVNGKGRFKRKGKGFDFVDLGAQPR